MTSSRSILAPLDSADLFNRGLLSHVPATGSNRLHKRRLNRSSDEENHHIPLNVSLSSPAADDAFAMIPVTLISYETLLYVGFSEAKAAELWAEWTNWPTQPSTPRREIDSDDGGLIMTFENFFTGVFERPADATDDNAEQWRACLNKCGMAADVQDAIMDARFKYLRLSQSCLYWVNDTVQMRYAGLEDIQRSSSEREKQLKGSANDSGNQGVSGHGGQQGGPNTIAGSSTGSSSQSQGLSSGFQAQHTPSTSPDIWGSTNADATCNAPGHTVLYRSMDRGRLNGLFDADGALKNINVLQSLCPSDFSGNRSLFYFTPDRQVAVRYAAYARKRALCESVAIVCLCIPNAAIQSLSAPDIQRIYWPSNEWKELIWHCRTNQTPPKRLRKYRQALLVIGTISGKPNRVYDALDSWIEITEKFPLQVGSTDQFNPAVQYAFSSEPEGSDFLKENGGRNIKVFTYPQSELESWLAANHSSD